MLAETLSPSDNKQRSSDRGEAVSFYALLLVAAWVPLPFGSVHPWAWGLLATMVGALLIFRAVNDLAAGARVPTSFRQIRLPVGLFALALAWALVQCLTVVPGAWHNPLWRDAADLLSAPRLQSAISLDPAASRAGIVRLATYGAIFWLSFRCCREPDRARQLILGVAVIGTLYAAWGLANFWAGDRYVLWYPKWAYWGELTSTFINRNSYATFAGLSLVAVVGLLLDLVIAKVAFGEGRRAVLRSLLETVATRGAWLVGAAAVDATALLLTHSRGGLGATFAGIVGLFVVAALAPSLRGSWRLWCGAVLLITASVMLLLAGGATLDRLSEVAGSVVGRDDINHLTWQAITADPLLGTGLGTFKYVFPLRRPETLTALIDLAHNDYLENMLELGIPAAAALFAAVFLLLIICIRGALQRRRDAIIPCVGAAATVLVGLHAWVDFSLQNPAVTTFFALLLGAGVAQSASQRADGGKGWRRRRR